VVLEQLLLLAPGVGVRLVSRLTGGLIEMPPADFGAVNVRTQVEAVKGRPDLEISSLDRLVWVEVKAEAELRTGQLDGYRVLLGETGVTHTRLVLLTRYPESFAPGAVRPDLEIRWFELADWLEQEMPSADEAGAIAGFLVRQFHDFLGGRG